MLQGLHCNPFNLKTIFWRCVQFTNQLLKSKGINRNTTFSVHPRFSIRINLPICSHNFKLTDLPVFVPNAIQNNLFLFYSPLHFKLSLSSCCCSLLVLVSFVALIFHSLILLVCDCFSGYLSFSWRCFARTIFPLPGDERGSLLLNKSFPGSLHRVCALSWFQGHLLGPTPKWPRVGFF